MRFQDLVEFITSAARSYASSTIDRLSSAVDDLERFQLDRVITAVLVFLVFLLLRRAIRYVMFLMTRGVFRSNRTLHEQFENALRRPIGFLPIVAGTFFAFEIVKVDESGLVARITDQIVGTLIIVAAYWILFALIGPLLEQLRPKSSQLTETVVDWIGKALRSLVVFFALAAILQQWGIRVGPLLTSLGIVGAAVALGAQTLFKNLISGVLILLEARFQYGDWIQVPGVVEGTVEVIGFRSTRVRRFDDATVHVPNADLADNAVVNYAQMRKRRIFWVIGVPYSTTPDQLKTIIDGITKYIHENEDFVSFKIASTFVRVDSFGGSSINIMVYCFTKTKNWGEWLIIKEQLAYKAIEVILGAGSSFAFPSTSLYVESLPHDKPDLFLPPENGAPRIEKAP
jgi:MscS family membrane protein